MKKKLLLLAFLAFFSFKSLAQATALQVDEISQCMYEIFDLTVQTPLTLGPNQPASLYSVTYFTSLANAASNTNAIVTPHAYIITGGWEQEIFIRVANNTTGDFDTTSFLITMQQGVYVPEFEDVITCGSYALPYLEWPALYYTGPNMVGPLSNNTVITSSQTIYIHAVSGVCNDESSFTITITGDGPAIFPPNPLVQCDENSDGIEIFDLTPIIEGISETAGVETVTVHLSAADAQNGTNPLAAPSAYTMFNNWQIQILYIRVVSASCETILPLQLIVIECETDNTFSGHVRFDTDGDGCDNSDTPAAGIWVYYIHNNSYHYAYTDANGYYEFNNVPDGVSYVSVEAWPLAFTASPAGIDLTFPGADPIDHDFCLTIPEPVQDVAVYLFPIGNAQPGFESEYVLIIQNLGTITVSGTVTTQYDASNLTFIPSAGITQSGNTLTLNYSGLGAFETQYFYFSGTLAPPPALNIGDVITFTSIINPVTGDAVPANNTYVLDQQIVNSYDPNDISVREGEFITEEQADGYLHYTVRFQNTGNLQATNIRVEGILDANLDWDTFTPLGASHNYQTYRDGNTIRFMFDNINLPDSTSNEVASHGYVFYKIKPKTTVQLGDSMSAQAGIYFDFNSAVITNAVTTTIQALSNETFNSNTFVVYPNPANQRVNIRLQNAVSAQVTVTDILGRTVLATSINGNEGALDIAQIPPGVYFITLNADGRQITKKLVIK